MEKPNTSFSNPRMSQMQKQRVEQTKEEEKMNKKSQIQRMLGIFGIIIVFAVIIGIVLVIFGQFPQATLQGFSVVSITAPNIVSENQNLRDFDWIVIANVGTARERIIGRVTPDQFMDRSGTSSEYTFELDAQSFDEQIEYSVINQDENIPAYEYVAIKSTGIFKNLEPCPSGTVNQYIEENGIGTPNVRHCLISSKYGTKGILSEPRLEFSAEMKFSIPERGIESTEVISSDDPSARFEYNGQRLADVSWEGSLVRGEGLPDFDEYVTVLTVKNNRWHLILDDAWTNYLISKRDWQNIWLQGEFEQLSDDRGSSDDLIDALENRLFSYQADRRRYIDTEIYLPSTSWLERQDEDDAKLTFSSDVTFRVPELKFLIRADWLGVKILSGQPSIRSASCSVAESGGINVITFDVRNVGDEDANFIFRKEGCPSFSASSNQISIDVGETQTGNLILTSGLENQDIEEQCILIVEDSADDTRSDSKTVTCEVRQALTCTPNQQYRVGLCVYECNSEGTGSTTEDPLFCCSSTPVYDSVVLEYKCPEANIEICDDGIDNDGDGKIDEEDSDCKRFFRLPEFNALTILGIIFIILSGIASYYGQLGFARRFKFKRNKTLFVIVSILLSILLFILLFMFLWQTIIVAIVLTIIAFIIMRRR